VERKEWGGKEAWKGGPSLGPMPTLVTSPVSSRHAVALTFRNIPTNYTIVIWFQL